MHALSRRIRNAALQTLIGGALFLLSGVTSLAIVPALPAYANTCCVCRVNEAIQPSGRHHCWFNRVESTACNAVPVPPPGDSGSILSGTPSHDAIAGSSCFPAGSTASQYCADSVGPWEHELCEDVGIVQGWSGERDSQGTPVNTESITREGDTAISSTQAVAPTGQQLDEGTANFRSLTPVLSVPIPGVSFTDASISNGEVTVPFLAQYILGVYRFAIGAAAILASIMVVYGGFRYLLGSTLGDVKEGKTVIQNAVIGLIVLLCSYVILQSINPDLVTLRSLTLSYIVRDAAGENSWDGQGGSFTSASGDGSCPQGGQIQTQELDGHGTFKVLPLPKEYKMFQGAWKDIAYGPDLPNNASTYPCRCGCQQGRNPDEACPGMGANNACPDGAGASQTGSHAYSAANNMCIGTIGQGGCGPTSFAVAMAYYGVNVSDSGSTQLANQALFWKRGADNSTNNSPDHMQSNNGWTLVNAHEADTTLENSLRARAQAHLYDPLDAAKDAVRFGSRPVNRGTATGFMGRAASEHSLSAIDIPVGSNTAATIGQHVAQGHPVIFLCDSCHLTVGRSRDKTYSGHYMVIHGANTENTFFLVSDVGSGSSDKSYLAADQITGGHVSHIVAITPQGGGQGQCRGNGQTTTGSSSDSLSSTTGPVTAGGITMQKFTYQPSGGQGWNANQSVILFPQRLTSEFAAVGSGGTRPRLRMYVYIHGGPGGAQKVPERSEYVSRLRNALQSVAGSKNIVIVAPHYYGQGYCPIPGNDHHTCIPFMNRFNLQEFYRQALAAAVQSIPGSRPEDFIDTVVGGHSASNCDGQLTQAVRTPLPNQRGIVLYDGCLDGDGDRAVTPSTFPIPRVGDSTGSLYFNPDRAGMGDDVNRYSNVRRDWGLRSVDCPGFVAGISPRTECFSHVIGGTGNAHREVASFETHLDHGNSVTAMTKFMFATFYGNDH